MARDVIGGGIAVEGGGAVVGELITGTPVEGFEGDLSHWNGDSITAGELEIVTDSGHEVEGSGALHHTGGDFSRIQSDPGDGLSYYPEFGDRVRWYVEAAQLAYQIDVRLGRVDSSNYYLARVHFGQDRIQCDPVVGGTTAENNWDKNLGLETGTTYAMDFDWQATKTLRIWPYQDGEYDASNPLGDASTSRTDHDGERGIAVTDFVPDGDEAWTDYIHVL